MLELSSDQENALIGVVEICMEGKGSRIVVEVNDTAVAIKTAFFRNLAILNVICMSVGDNDICPEGVRLDWEGGS